MKKFILTILLFCILATSYNQIIISNIEANSLLEKIEYNQFKTFQFKNIESVKLPFIDDFSNRSNYPDSSLWIDNKVFINNDYCFKPLTVGVATLDALDAYGQLYNTAQITTFNSDTLTSKPIRLDTIFYTIPKRAITLSDSIYFSFMYQPGGGIGASWELKGDKPENGDSLILEFGYQTGNNKLWYIEYQPQIITEILEVGDSVENNCYLGSWVKALRVYLPNDTMMMLCDSILVPEVVWEKVWAKNGTILQTIFDSTGKYFNQINIPIIDTKYLNKGFQFRFRNLASLGNNSLPGFSGNVDQWNIDYIKLDINRSLFDTNYKDVSFASKAPTSLKNYQVMPWSQFKGFQSQELSDTFRLNISNLDKVEKRSSYTYLVEKKDGSNIYSFPLNFENILPYYNNGYHNYQPHSRPSINFTFPEDVMDSANFRIRHIFKSDASDDRTQNDTIIYEQNFYNYYAYDDGTSENGFGLSPAGARLAYQFKLNHEDTLRAINFYFNRTYNNENVQYFWLTVWNDNNGQPGSVIYEQSSVRPLFADSLNKFVTYFLNNPIKISGTFYIGWRQTNSINLNLGYDRNINSSDRIFYNSDGSWLNPFYFGSLMMRPIVGEYFSTQNIDEINFNKIAIYPNPIIENCFFANFQENLELYYSIYDVAGRKVFSNKLERQNYFDNLKNGFYFIEITDNKHFRKTEKIIINK